MITYEAVRASRYCGYYSAHAKPSLARFYRACYSARGFIAWKCYSAPAKTAHTSFYRTLVLQFTRLAVSNKRMFFSTVLKITGRH